MHGRNWKLSDVEVDVKGFESAYPVAPPGDGNAAAGYDSDDSLADKSPEAGVDGGGG